MDLCFKPVWYSFSKELFKCMPLSLLSNPHPPENWLHQSFTSYIRSVSMTPWPCTALPLWSSRGTKCLGCHVLFVSIHNSPKKWDFTEPMYICTSDPLKIKHGVISSHWRCCSRSEKGRASKNMIVNSIVKSTPREQASEGLSRLWVYITFNWEHLCKTLGRLIKVGRLPHCGRHHPPGRDSGWYKSEESKVSTHAYVYSFLLWHGSQVGQIIGWWLPQVLWYLYHPSTSYRQV